VNDVDAIFDRFERLSAKIHQADAERRRIEQLRARAARECGQCGHWMKSRLCPIDDRRRGFPSCHFPACGKYTPTKDAINAQLTLNDCIDELQEQR
jgi:hypothetical protein